MDLTDKLRTFHPKAAEYILFSGVHGTFSRIDHMLGHKPDFNKYNKTEIIPCIFSDHNAMKQSQHRKNLERPQIYQG